MCVRRIPTLLARIGSLSAMHSLMILHMSRCGKGLPTLLARIRFPFLVVMLMRMSSAFTGENSIRHKISGFVVLLMFLLMLMLLLFSLAPVLLMLMRKMEDACPDRKSLFSLAQIIQQLKYPNGI